VSGLRRSVVVLVGAALLAACSAPPTSPPVASSPVGPSPVASSPAPPPSVAPSPAPAVSSAAPPLRFVFPVRGKASYGTTHAGYPATDIFAGCGTPVVAVTSGRMLEVSRVDRYTATGPQGPDNGGRSVSLLGDDGVRYYGSHLLTVAPGIGAGVRVVAGQRLGAVGRTGHANGVCHLHFGVSPPCARTGDWWIRRGVVWPAPFLDGWRAGRQVGAGSAVRAWHRDHGCPAAPPGSP
jgi:murein DD-endopeptidase MepM/ murein hydrolase activator NlpD